MSKPLPHDPYIEAVVDALTAAGLEPTKAWTSDTELDRYRDDDLYGLACMLDAYLTWEDDHPALNTEKYPQGIALIWDHPAEEWQWAARKDNGHLIQDPEFLPNLGRYSDPAAVVDTVRALLAGEPLSEGHAPYWHLAGSVRAAVDAWAAGETTE
ncbi:hypothetical protein [Streptomyces sp. Amel2xC10]|uniref:hypothetical protein n=1 Tax=Streptomyces sp. Amel2xC10 TaxID=1305826 RepID=UPI000A08AD46|nr:hypothetical protein [Streptomyces sp. Amel2xC10]SMF86390.1 hypothetical protein SAMN02745830_07161 [Streptomyces sp. Amel2xC10]